MTTTQNNVAAQAGDEPIKRYDLTYRDDFSSKHGADADEADDGQWVRFSDIEHLIVERNLRAELINAGALRQYCHNDGSAGFVTAYDFDITNRFLAAIATTKPGA